MGKLLHSVREYVLCRLEADLPPNRYYHSLDHTLMVVKVCEEIAGHYQLAGQDLENLLTAAWFHDLGHISQYHDHERESIKLATAFLDKQGVSQDRIAKISRLIMSTHIEIEAKGLLEEIIHDADIFNIGNDTFFQTGDSLRKEWKEAEGRTFSDREWNQLQYEFLLDNDFLTEYAREKYGPMREENIQLAKKKLDQ